MCKIELSFWYFNCCESTKKLKDPFLKVESICLYVPNVDNFQYKKYSYLICQVYVNIRKCLPLPPPSNRAGFWRSRNISATTPPLNRAGFRRSRTISATTPLTEWGRLQEITDDFCYYPPPLNRFGFYPISRKYLGLDHQNTCFLYHNDNNCMRVDDP